MIQSDTHTDSAADSGTHTDSAADIATDSTVTAGGWQGGYETSATEPTGYAGQSDSQDEGQWNSTEEASLEETDQQWVANQTDAEGYSTSQDYSYESALHQTTEQFEQSYQSEETVTDRWTDETGEGEESLANQWRSESQDVAEQQMSDQQPGEQQADEQPAQQSEEEQPIADSQPADLDNGEDQEQAPADDYMPDVPNSDAASQYDPYLAPETEWRPNQLSAGDSADESGDSAGRCQGYESRYDPYAEHHDPSNLGSIEQQESAASQSQYGNWEDPQAGIPFQGEPVEALSPQASESVYEPNAQPSESGNRYEYEYCPSDAAPRYQYTPSEPAYGCPYPNDVQQDDSSIVQQPAETTESQSAEAPRDDQFQADPAEQHSDNDMEATGSREVDAEETQPGDDQSSDAVEGESLDWPTGVRFWDEEPSCRQDESSWGQDESSWGEENQSYNEGEQYDEEQMQSDDGAFQHVPYQESPYDVMDDSNGSDEHNWQSQCGQYPGNTQEASQSDRFEQPYYKYEHPYDDFRADDSNFEPDVPEEVTSSPAWESSSADNGEPQYGCRDLQAESFGCPSEHQTREFAEQIEGRHAEHSSQSTCDDGFWSAVQQSGEEQHSGDDGYHWDAGYGKYGASGELVTPADQTADDSQWRDRPDADEESDARSEDVELSRPSDQQMDWSADSQSAGDNQGASDQYDSPAQECEDSAEPQSQMPVSEETETEDDTSAPRWSEGWVPSKPHMPDAMPAVEDPIGNQGEQSNPFPADAGSNWIPLPNYGYPASPTSTEYFLPPHVDSDYSVEFRGRQ